MEHERSEHRPEIAVERSAARSAVVGTPSTLANARMESSLLRAGAVEQLMVRTSG